MGKRFSILQRIDNNEKITRENHYEFLYLLQNALLLALKEQGTLGAIEYRYAEEKMKNQRLDRAKRILKKGGTGC